LVLLTDSGVLQVAYLGTEQHQLVLPTKEQNLARLEQEYQLLLNKVAKGDNSQSEASNQLAMAVQVPPHFEGYIKLFLKSAGEQCQNLLVTVLAALTVVCVVADFRGQSQEY